MTEFVLCGDALVRTSSARISKEQVNDFRESTQLLEQAHRIAGQAEEHAKRAREEGYREGLETALIEMRDVLADCAARLQQSVTQEDARRERAASIAAMQAVEQLIGGRDDAEVATGLVREAMQRSGAKPLRIIVAPQWVDAVRAELPDTDQDLVEGDTTLEMMGCRIEVEGGRIIADLEKQLDALRTRWNGEPGASDG